MSQASEAMKLAASSGMTLKEAWAQVKGEGGGASDTSSPGPAVERGEHTIAKFKAIEDSW